jgi:ribosome maturation factor RimP
MPTYSRYRPDKIEKNRSPKKTTKHFENPFENYIFADVKKEGSRRHRFLFYSWLHHMIEKRLITDLAEEYLKDSPDYLVDVIVGADNTITVEIDNDKGVDIEECVSLSRHLESKLDRDKEDFELTVTSAGLTSPFKTQRQYKKFEGKEVEVLGKNGQKATGFLKSSDAEGFTLTVTKKIKPEGAKRKTEITEDLRFAFEEVKHTKYLIRFK